MRAHSLAHGGKFSCHFIINRQSEAPASLCPSSMFNFPLFSTHFLHVKQCNEGQSYASQICMFSNTAKPGCPMARTAQSSTIVVMADRICHLALQTHTHTHAVMHVPQHKTHKHIIIYHHIYSWKWTCITTTHIWKKKLLEVCIKLLPYQY